MADKQLAKKGKAGVDNTFRRTWDKQEFAERAAKREKEVSLIAPYFALDTCWLLHCSNSFALLSQLDVHRRKMLRKARLTQRKGGA